MRLYIVRHGEPDYATDHLTELGQRQAEAVARRMERSGIDRIFCSPMNRAQETANPTCRRLGMEPTILPWAHEIGPELSTTYPDGLPKSVSKVQNTHYRENGNMDLGYARACESPGLRESGMRQAAAYLEENGNALLERLGYRYENGVYRIVRPTDERVALFCHAAMARAWISVLLHIPLNIMWAGSSYEFTGVTLLEFKNNPDGFTAPVCLCFSDTSHLYAEGLKGWN